jgi:hypothetical protein
MSPAIWRGFLFFTVVFLHRSKRFAQTYAAAKAVGAPSRNKRTQAGTKRHKKKQKGTVSRG